VRSDDWPSRRPAVRRPVPGARAASADRSSRSYAARIPCRMSRTETVGPGAAGRIAVGRIHPAWRRRGRRNRCGRDTLRGGKTTAEIGRIVCHRSVGKGGTSQRTHCESGTSIRPRNSPESDPLTAGLSAGGRSTVRCPDNKPHSTGHVAISVLSSVIRTESPPHLPDRSPALIGPANVSTNRAHRGFPINSSFFPLRRHRHRPGDLLAITRAD